MKPTRKSRLGLSGLQVLLCAFFIVSIILPLLRMLVNMTATDFAAIVNSGRFGLALVNSLSTSATATAISVGLAMLLSWCTVRSGIRLKGLWTMLFTLPMLIPSLSHGMGLMVLFGSNGIMTRLLGLGWDVYGFWGIVFGSVLYSFPVAFLMISDILRYEDSSPYEAASVLGISRWRQGTAITLPYLRRPLISVFFSVFTMVVTDYGVPLTIGTPDTLTLPVMMYQDVIQGMDFGKGSVIGMVLLTPALIAFVIDLLNRDRGNSAFVLRPFSKRRNPARDGLAYAACTAVGVLLLLPIAAFALMTFVKKYPIDLTFTVQHILRTFSMSAGRYLGNSLLISVLVSTLGVLIAGIVAYLSTRIHTRASRALHLISITSLAIPGLVLGLSYALFFKGTALYNTLAILVMVNLVHFFASPYLLMVNSLHKINQNIEAVGATVKVGRMRIVWDVLIPQTRGTIVEMFTYFFVNSMMTISAVSFLATSDTRPFALLIPSFQNSMMIENVAFVSLLILLVNLTIRGAASLYKKRLGAR